LTANVLYCSCGSIVYCDWKVCCSFHATSLLYLLVLGSSVLSECAYGGARHQAPPPTSSMLPASSVLSECAYGSARHQAPPPLTSREKRDSFLLAIFNTTRQNYRWKRRKPSIESTLLAVDTVAAVSILGSAEKG
jgi:hypothetical protein